MHEVKNMVGEGKRNAKPHGNVVLFLLSHIHRMK